MTYNWEVGTCVRLVYCVGMPDSLVPDTIRFDLKPRTFGNRLVVVQCVGTLLCVWVYLARL
jgi:hypothetical protein